MVGVTPSLEGPGLLLVHEASGPVIDLEHRRCAHAELKQSSVRASSGERAPSGAGGAEVYGWYFSSTVSPAPDLGFMVTRTVTLPVFAAFSNWSTVHFEVP